MDLNIEKLESQLQSRRLQLEKLEAEINRAGIHGDRRMLALKEKQAAAEATLAQLKAAGNEKWDQFKTDIWIVWNDLENAFLDAQQCLGLAKK